jgi:hypothetical protein
MFAGPGALRALVDGRAGVVEVALSRGAYARLGSGWLLLAAPDAPFGPLSVGVHGVHGLALHPGTPVGLHRRRLVVGGHTVSLERMGERRAVAAGPTASASATRAACAAALKGLPGPPPTLREGIAALVHARVDDAARLLAGLGEGLTPAGDDVLAGYAAARAAAGHPVAPSVLAAGRSSPLGLAYLRCAERGELPDAGARLLAAIRGGSIAAVEAALPPVRQWGASSGAALAWGMTAAFAPSSDFERSLRSTERGRSRRSSDFERSLRLTECGRSVRSTDFERSLRSTDFERSLQSTERSW